MKDSNHKTGTGCSVCQYFEEIDTILGTRAASEPAVILDSATGPSTTPDLEGIYIYIVYT